MKTRFRRISRKSLSILLAVVMMLTTILAGTITASASFKNWKIYGKVYFLAPSGFTSNSYVYHSIDQVETNYHDITPMTLLGNSGYSRLYYAWVSKNHSNWNKNEYTRFLAYTSSKSSDNWDLSGCYTAGEGTGIASNDKYFLYATASNADNANAAISKSDYDQRTGLNRKQTLKTYLGSSSNVTTGGKIEFSYWELNDDASMKSSATTGNTSTYESYDIYPVIGSKVTLTASPNTGYEFDGWYNGSTLLSSDASYSYWVYAEQTDIRAMFKAKTYTISYNKGANGTGTVADTPKTHGTDVALSSNTFTRTGYTQTGWSNSDGGAKAYNLGGTYSTNASTTLYPYWTINTYTISYDKGANGTGTVASTTKTYGVNATLSSSTFTREGYTQTGWATTDGGNKAYDLGGTYIANAAITLYPYWEQNEYDIHYSGSHVTFSNNPAAGVYNNSVSFNAAATSGYAIRSVSGYYVDGNNVQHTLTITGSNGSYGFTQPDGEVYINVETILPRTVTVNMGTGVSSYVVNGISYSANNVFTVGNDESFAISSVSYATGYEADSENLSHDHVTSNLEINLTAKKIDYDITKDNATNGSFLVKKGGSEVSTANMGDTVVVEPSPATDYEVNKVEVYYSNSWHTVAYSSGYSFTMPAEAVHVKVTFNEKKYTVTPSAGNHGTVSPTTDLQVGNVTAVALPTATPDTGYAFSHWEGSTGVTVVNDSAVRANQSGTIIARFEPKNYTITVANDGHGTIAVSGTPQYGQTITVTNTPNTYYSYAYFVVKNLSTNAETTYQSGTSFAMPADNVLVTGHFSEITYPVTVVSQNTTMGTVGEDTVQAGMATWHALPAANPKTGYEFVEWEITSGSANAQLQNSTSRTGATIKASAACTVTAKFRETLRTVSVVSQKEDNVTLGTVTPVQGQAGEVTSFSATATPKTGYVFKSWTGSNLTITTPDSSTPNIVNIKASADATATANFKATILYLDTSNKMSNGKKWSADRATFKAEFGGNGTLYSMTAVSEDTDMWQVAIPSGVTLGTTEVKFYRYDSTGTTEWNHSKSMTTSETKNLFKVTGWNDASSIQATPYFPPITHQVTFTVSGGGVSAITYKEGSKAAKTYNSGTALSVNVNDDVVFTVTYATGYEYSAHTNCDVSDTTVSNDTFTVGGTGATANVSATLTTRMTDFSVTTVTAPEGIPSGNGISSNKATAHYQESVTFTITTSAGYYLTSLKEGNNSISYSTSQGGDGQSYIVNYTMPARNVTITATFAMEPAVTYYVDMHNNTVNNSDKRVQIAVVTNAGGGTVASGVGTYSDYATRQGDSTVYAATLTTPVTMVGSEYSSVYIRVTYGTGDNKKDSVITISGSAPNSTSGGNVTQLVSTKEAWIEIANGVSVDFSAPPKNHNSATVASGYKRLYLAKPKTDWNSANMGIYYWGNTSSDPTCTDWNAGIHMTEIGSDSSYDYYYVDVLSGVKNIVFQGWADNTTAGSYAKTQTENIESIGYKNYFVIKKGSGDKFELDSSSTVSVPKYTSYIDTVRMNKDYVNENTVSIMPTYTGGKVTFTPTGNNSSNISVNSDGQITSVSAAGTYTINVKVFSEVGANATTITTNGDILSYDVIVTVSDPTMFNKFNLMSLETRTTTVTVPTINGDHPGYVYGVTATVSGVTNIPANSKNAYTNSAVISKVGNEGYSYTVKYAKPNSNFTITTAGTDYYSSITVKGVITTKSNLITNSGQRYGISSWRINDSSTDDAVMTDSIEKTVNEGVETATSKGTFDGSTLKAIFTKYAYVDVNFRFEYYEYNTVRKVVKKDDEGQIVIENNATVYEDKVYNQYDPDYVGNEEIGASGWNTVPNTPHNTDFKKDGVNTHIGKVYNVTGFEVRGKTASQLTSQNIVDEAMDAIKNMPQNGYYTYNIDASRITISYDPLDEFHASATVVMQHVPKTYTVKRNGNEITDGTAANGKYYYQEYASLTLSGGTENTVWKQVGSTWSSGDAIPANAAVLARGATYKFRVVENTYLATETVTPSQNQLTESYSKLKSSVKNAGQAISYEDKEENNVTTTVEMRTNNFYISDFFDPENVLDPASAGQNNGASYIPYDDAEFVGGGIMYYSMNGADANARTPGANAVTNGYVNQDGSLAVEQVTGIDGNPVDVPVLKSFIKARILENKPDSSVTDSEDLANSIAFGTEIAPQFYKVNGKNQGIAYRYLPYRYYKRVGSQNTLETALDSDNNQYYTFATLLNSDVYRYSNALQAYNYIYGDIMKNDSANANKYMRLYAYYVYSYTKYDSDTGVPYTEYEIVLSDNYADASVYFDGITAG